jgi:uncharacterized protein YprB with RNaseH-like and TPR domain
MGHDIKKKLDELASREPSDTGRSPDGPEDKEELRRVVKKLRNRSAEKRRSRPAIRYERGVPHTHRPPPSSEAADGDHLVLEEAVKGAEINGCGAGPFFLIENPLPEIEEQAGELQAAFDSAFRNPGSGLRQRMTDLWPEGGIEPSDTIFLDIETTGLSCSPLFLIGTMWWDKGELVVRQYLARDYSEERAVIERFAERFHDLRLLVTFNGKSFDMPYLRMRAASTRVELPPEPPHFDLLHVCRRVWKDSLPNCKLQTLETHICRRPRCGDIPGEQIPPAYHAFVRSGDARRMVRILHHNMLDLVTMADLMVRLPEEE